HAGPRRREAEPVVLDRLRGVPRLPGAAEPAGLVLVVLHPRGEPEADDADEEGEGGGGGPHFAGVDGGGARGGAVAGEGTPGTLPEQAVRVRVNGRRVRIPHPPDRQNRDDETNGQSIKRCPDRHAEPAGKLFEAEHAELYPERSRWGRPRIRM